ncbi:MAG: T9SS type A sorting domain-containing protein [Ignavibacteriales bacterium]|nr:T9SS type A sorting domain-containing protein [Ignavibacteriales bacterium]
MRIFVMVVTTLIFILSFSFGQTEAWRLPGHYYAGAAGTGGDIFLAKSAIYYYGFSLPDTIKKVTSAGVVAKQLEVNGMIRNIIYSGTGLYTLFYSSTTSDSITYYDDNLNGQWSINLGSDYYSSNKMTPKVDQSGNLYIVQSDPLSLLKITKDGTIAFRKNLSRPTFTIDFEDISGPVIDQNGNIVIVQCVVDYQNKTAKGATIESQDGYYYLYRTDTTNSSPITQSLFLKKDKMLYFKDAGAKWEDFQLNDYSYLLKNLVIQNGFVAIGGMHSYNATKVTKKWKEESISQWRMLFTGADRKAKKFSYKGKGGDACNGSEPGLNYKNDDMGNNLEWIVNGTGDQVCLIGSTSRNKLRCGEGQWGYDGVVMAYNLATKKIAWKIIVRDTIYGAIYQKESGKIFAGYYNGNSLYYKVFDQNGGIGPTLNFGQTQFINPRNFMIDLNRQDDAMYLNFGSPAEWYFVKYSIPSMEFKPSTFSNYSEEPLQFELQQNYPNPFNPSTTIEFTLAQSSLVTLKIYNMLGQEVATILNHEEMEAGSQEVEYNAIALSSGVYFYRLEATGISNEDGTGSKKYTELKKMILMK